MRLLYPDARIEPADRSRPRPPCTASRTATRRARVCCAAGPRPRGRSRRRARRARLGLRPADVERGLRQLEGRGFVLRGRFTPGATAEDEFCDRRLLARIHRYTLDRLRREIDPVSAQDFMRFLLRWQHLAPDTQLAGKQGVRQAIARLQGFEAPAGAWERELLAARVSRLPLLLAGRALPRRRGRLGAADASQGHGRAAAANAGRVDAGVASRCAPTCRRCSRPCAAPKAIRRARRRAPRPRFSTCCATRGALFFDEIVNGTRRLRSDVERGLRELVAWGLVTADGFQGLRQLVGGKSAHLGPPPSSRRRVQLQRRRLLRRHRSRRALGARARAGARPRRDRRARGVGRATAPAALRRPLPRPLRARELHGALARRAAGAAPPGSARHRARRALRLRPHRRAVRAARGRRRPAASAARPSARASASGSAPSTR